MLYTPLDQKYLTCVGKPGFLKVYKSIASVKTMLVLLIHVISSMDLTTPFS